MRPPSPLASCRAGHGRCRNHFSPLPCWLEPAAPVAESLAVALAPSALGAWLLPNIPAEACMGATAAPPALPHLCQKAVRGSLRSEAFHRSGSRHLEAVGGAERKRGSAGRPAAGSQVGDVHRTVIQPEACGRAGRDEWVGGLRGYTAMPGRLVVASRRGMYSTACAVHAGQHMR